MGLIYADIELANPKNGSLKPMAIKALVDTDAMTICVPEHIAIQLQLREIEKREVTTADERSHLVPYVGPVQIKFANRTCFTGALVIGESVLMGAVPEELMSHCRITRDDGGSLAANEQVELQSLVEAELEAARRRAEATVREIER